MVSEEESGRDRVVVVVRNLWEWWEELGSFSWLGFYMMVKSGGGGRERPRKVSTWYDESQKGTPAVNGVR